MKLSLILLAAGLLSFSAASAQTTPGTTRPSVPGPDNMAGPSRGTSGMAPPTANPKGNVSPAEVFTKGDPNGNKMRNHDMMDKRKKTKTTMDGTKMKTKM